MQRIVSIWAALDSRRRTVLVAGVLALLVTLGVMFRLATSPNMVLLYAGLEDGVAGEVVSALEQRGVVYEVRGNSVFVEGRDRDALRMALAGEGLPTNDGQGYELLDGLTGFGTTSQMFDAAYWRAKEGELARTIAQSPSVAKARVHVANTFSAPFANRTEPSASVALVTTGGSISSEQADAFRHLVASAIGGLSVDNVTIIDSTGAILGGGDERAASSANDRASEIRNRVMRLMEARVGVGNAVVEVSVEPVTESEAIRERRFDPNGRIAISTDTEERTNTNSTASDSVTVASNLPDGDAASDQTSSGESREVRERVNYEVSETEREIIRAAGAIKRLSVAVLINGVSTTNADGTIGYAERPQEELDVLRDLVASAVGFSEDRGDTISIHSLELPMETIDGTVAEASFLSRFPIDMMSLLQMVILGIASVILGLFVVRPILLQPQGAPPIALSAPPLDGSAATLPAGDASMPLGLDPDEVFSPSIDTLPASQSQLRVEPIDRLKDMIAVRENDTVELLRDWLENKEGVS